MKQSNWIYYLLISLLLSCQSKQINATFIFKKNNQGLSLSENGRPIFFYQKKPKSLNGAYVCNNYIHPLYSLKGDTLTEEFPIDHPYHRGIFWAWHQIHVNEKHIGNSWTMENIQQIVTDIHTTIENEAAQLNLSILWQSPLFKNNTPFISETTRITVHPLYDGVRKIDFAIALKALVQGVEIGGADNQKGYGGFCMRIKLPNDLLFTSKDGKVTPKLEQITTGPWMDFSATFGSKNATSGLALLCHPKTLNYPAPWILRQQTSMQNIVFPGRNRIKIPMDKPLSLCYRLVIHEGSSNNINLNKLQSEYEKMTVSIF